MGLHPCDEERICSQVEIVIYALIYFGLYFSRKCVERFLVSDKDTSSVKVELYGES